MNRYEMSVFLACVEVHGHVARSGPHMSEAKLIDTTRWLSERLAAWAPSKPGREKYDDAVRSLIIATIQESVPSKRTKRG